MNKKDENKPPNKKLILHFDVQNTLIIEDKRNGLSKDAHVHQILASQAWGQLEQKDAKSPIQWKLQYNHFSVAQPEKDLLNYKQYVDSLYPLKEAEDEPNEESRKVVNNTLKASRASMYNSLVKTGGPGLKLKPEYDKIMKAITLPRLVSDYVANELQREEEPNVQASNAGSEEEKVIDLLGDGKYYMLPGFFRLMSTLKKAKREFAIVFRSFGPEIADVIREMNSFCAGEHPCFNGRNNTALMKFDGSKNNKNFRVKANSTAVVYRNESSDIEECAFALGSIQRKQSVKAHRETDASAQIAKGTHQIHAVIQQLLKESCALGLQDDEQSWKKGENLMVFAKPLIVDQNDYLTQHIFLSSSVTEDDDCGVDVRDAVTGESLPIESTLNKYIAKVETIEAIRNQDYFLKLIELCERNRAEDIERIERPSSSVGVAVVAEEQSQVDVPPQKSEFQILMESPSDVYLRNTILPLLSTGLRICDTERPQDPISFLASYILKNKERVRIPVPPPIEPQDPVANGGTTGEEEADQAIKEPEVLPK